MRVEPKMKIVVVKPVNNPTRKGTERYKRVEAVLKSKSVESALARGAMPSTISFCHERRLIKLVK